MADKPIPLNCPMVSALLDGRKTQTRRVLKPQPKSSDFRGILLDENVALFGAARIRNCQHVALPYARGDRLWVQEGFCEAHPIAFQPNRAGLRLLHAGIPGPPSVDYLVAYRADGELLPYWHCHEYPFRTLDPNDEIDRKHFPHGCETGWLSPVHMPRCASRLTLTVTDVRVQRVQEITNADAVAEGIERLYEPPGFRDYLNDDPTARVAMNPSFRSLWDSINAKRGYGWDMDPWVVALTFDVHRCNIDNMGMPA